MFQDLQDLVEFLVVKEHLVNQTGPLLVILHMEILEIQDQLELLDQVILET